MKMIHDSILHIVNEAVHCGEYTCIERASVAIESRGARLDVDGAPHTEPLCVLVMHMLPMNACPVTEHMIGVLHMDAAESLTLRWPCH